jgi:eukaryotic-like serine/threonine-protein kinase
VDQNTYPVFVETGVPAVSGLSVGEASERIADAGFVEGGDLRRYSEWISSWSVLGTDPAEGEPLPEGATVNLVLRANDSSEKAPSFDSRIPDVDGLDVDAAAAILQRFGYTTSFLTSFDARFPESVVTGTTPSAGTFLPPTGNVQLFISSGPRHR